MFRAKNTSVICILCPALLLLILLSSTGCGLHKQEDITTAQDSAPEAFNVTSEEVAEKLNSWYRTLAEGSVFSPEDINVTSEEVIEKLGSWYINLAEGSVYLHPAENSLGLDPEPLPTYTPGTTFVYSDGTWEKVVKATPENITWIDYRGYTSSGLPDIIYRRVSWSTSSRKGSREFSPGKFLVGETTTTLWPLEAGNRVSYLETGRWSEKDGPENVYGTYWKCRVEGTEKVRVPAGEFDTWKIGCLRYISPAKAQVNRIREKKTWYYAPAAGHWVKYIRDFQKRRATLQRELVAVIPDIGAKADALGLDKTFQQALETTRSGKGLSWGSSGAKIRMKVVPQSTFRMAEGTYCRRYEQDIQHNTIKKTYYGMACRGTDGIWSVPRR